MSHARFLFLDETCVNTKMTRLYGRSMGGERLGASAPHGHWKSSTFLAAMGLDGIVAPAIFDGPCNAASFRAWILQQLVPALRPGDVVVMDNLAAHKQAAVEAAIRAVGANVMFTPPYSPDMNPIEKFFSKLKAALRAAEARTVAAVEGVVMATIKTLSRTECENYFLSCGYDSM
jgi:transposase